MEKTVLVKQWIKVTIDEKKFDEKFMKEFKENFYKFHTIDDHIMHLAQLHARGICYNDSFIEGYGEAEDMGIEFEEDGQEEEIYD